MLKVYIADDEDAVRWGLKKIIDWKTAGYEICGEASNGEQAFEDISCMNPELLLLDIRMPKIHGLELAKRLRANGYKGHIIILSGYSEFQYAKEAIRFSVDYYLTKPIEEEELLAAVVDIRDLILKQQMHEQHIQYYQEKAKDKILEELIQRESKSLAAFKFDYKALNLSAQKYQVLILDSEDADMKMYKALCRDLNVPVTSNGIDQLHTERFLVILLKDQRMIQRFLTLKDSLESNENRPYFIAAGEVVSDINEIYYSYHQALSVYERRFFEKEPVYIQGPEGLPKQKQLVNNFDLKDSKEIGKTLYEAIVIHKHNNIIYTLNELKQKLIYSKNSVESIKEILAGVYMYVIEAFKKDYRNYNVEFLTNAEIIRWFHECQYLYQIITFIEEETARMIQMIGGFTSESTIEEVIAYMVHHYGEDIKLKNIAPKFGYNSSYLGKLFAKKIGSSFNDYLHQIRIEKSKELLMDKRYKIYDVASLVGYKNVDYFYLKFKQLEGTTPKEYRLKHHIKADE